MQAMKLPDVVWAKTMAAMTVMKKFFIFLACERV
jgi:hypothetical protein